MVLKPKKPAWVVCPDRDQQVAGMDRCKAKSGLDWVWSYDPHGLWNTQPDASPLHYQGLVQSSEDGIVSQI